jgi:hypothetical protein
MELQDDFAAAALAIKPLTMKGLGNLRLDHRCR